jgi:hypothetical protein
MTDVTDVTAVRLLVLVSIVSRTGSTAVHQVGPCCVEALLPILTCPPALSHHRSVLVVIAHVAIAPALVGYLTSMPAAAGVSAPQAQMLVMQDTTLNLVCLIPSAASSSPSWPATPLALSDSLFWTVQVRTDGGNGGGAGRAGAGAGAGIDGENGQGWVRESEAGGVEHGAQACARSGG